MHDHVGSVYSAFNSARAADICCGERRALREKVLAQADPDAAEAAPADGVYRGLNNYTDYKKVCGLPVVHSAVERHSVLDERLRHEALPCRSRWKAPFALRWLQICDSCLLDLL